MIGFICPLSIPNAPFFWNFFDFTYAPALLYYAYIPIIVLSIFLALYVLRKDKFSLQSKLLTVLSLSFSVWVANVTMQWIAASADIVLFSWEITPIIEVFIPIATFYFFYVSTRKRDISSKLKILFAVIISAVAAILPTRFNVTMFDMANCQAVVGPLIYIVYVIEILSAIAILSFVISDCFAKKMTDNNRTQIIYLGVGSTIFLTIFSLANIFGEFLQTYQINLVGPLGMVVFLALLTYSIVRFKTFNAKVFGAQALVATLWILIGSILFVAASSTTRIITAITEILAIIFGLTLIKSVKKEVEQKERNERLALDLQHSSDRLFVANEKLKELDVKKTEFVSMAAHQLRAPLTAIKGYSSMLLEGSFGPIEQKAKDKIGVVFESSNRLNAVIEDFLNVTRIELGKMKYEMSDFDFSQLVKQVVAEQHQAAERKNMSLAVTIPPGQNYIIKGDYGKLAQVIGNLVDNAIKYSDRGAIVIKVDRVGEKLLFSVKDNGVGISKETMDQLFKKYSRASDAGKANATGTGLGLYVAKEIVEAHHGRIWAESAGPGMGSTFLVEL
jgi:signal transduction histidine kinase